MNPLPIDEIIPKLQSVLRKNNNAVLVAAPGAGKTTRVPLALLQEPWLAGKKIILLEPRRLAARAAARYMAASVGERVGETVGYRMRNDTRIGKTTRIEVVTEGVLTRMLLEDAALEGAGLVIFDEFHERNLHADLGFTFCLQAQALLRDDLRLLVMSATLAAEPVATLLGGAPVLACAGRVHPVETRFLPNRHADRSEYAVAQKVCEALRNDAGDILVFLPGAREIRRTEKILRELIAGQPVLIAPLYGSLPQSEQDRALLPAAKGERKVVLATSIAETSLTVEGVQIVIDGGFMRVPRFSPRTGMSHLETIPVSRAAADQRRGRAGRLGPGVCYRMWTEQEDRNLAPDHPPEIAAVDLAPLALNLAVWGATEPSELSWLTPPPTGAYRQACEVLRELGALAENGRITRHGRDMAALGMHPRLAHMVLKAIPLQLGELACELAALLSGRDSLRPLGGAYAADLRSVIAAVRSAGATATGAIDPAAAKRINDEANRWKRDLGIKHGGHDDIAACGLLLSFAYPDRIAQRKGAGRFLLKNGRGAVLSAAQPLAQEPYLVAAELDDAGHESRILLAAPIAAETLARYRGELITQDTVVAWDDAAQAVRARTFARLGAIALAEAAAPDVGREETAAALMQGIAANGLDMLPWTKAAHQLLDRLRFMHAREAGWPDVSAETLLATLPDWLSPYVQGMKSRSDLQKLSMAAIIENMLTWEQRRRLDEYAPTHIVVPSGSRIPVDYSDPSAPALFVRIQEMFGQQDTPRIARGQVPVTLHLLSPAQRPVQVTQDLANFWRSTYFAVRKDLKGRYPKHAWPDNPLLATATRHAKPRR
ncbi:MAG TPA: ATP-dependent helicase HrpB [Bacilli bacterium]